MNFAGEINRSIIDENDKEFSKSSRFINNIPAEQRNDVVRVFFAIELAHWFYLDFHREDDENLPNYSLKEFAEQSKTKRKTIHLI